MSELTLKQKAFCQEYIVDFNATQATIRAGYSKDTAQQIGAENLSKLVIQTEINKLIDKCKERVQVKQDRVIFELAKIAFSDITNYLSDDGLTFDVEKMKHIDSSVINSIEFDNKTIINDKKGYEVINNKIKVKLNDKIKALELLSKHLNLFNDNPNISIKNINNPNPFDGVDIKTKEKILKMIEENKSVIVNSFEGIPSK